MISVKIKSDHLEGPFVKSYKECAIMWFNPELQEIKLFVRVSRFNLFLIYSLIVKAKKDFYDKITQMNNVIPQRELLSTYDLHISQDGFTQSHQPASWVVIYGIEEKLKEGKIQNELTLDTFYIDDYYLLYIYPCVVSNEVVFISKLRKEMATNADNVLENVDNIMRIIQET